MVLAHERCVLAAQTHWNMSQEACVACPRSHSFFISARMSLLESLRASLAMSSADISTSTSAGICCSSTCHRKSQKTDIDQTILNHIIQSLPSHPARPQGFAAAVPVTGYKRHAHIKILKSLSFPERASAFIARSTCLLKHITCPVAHLAACTAGSTQI